MLGKQVSRPLFKVFPIFSNKTSSVTLAMSVIYLLATVSSCPSRSWEVHPLHSWRSCSGEMKVGGGLPSFLVQCGQRLAQLQRVSKVRHRAYSEFLRHSKQKWHL